MEEAEAARTRATRAKTATFNRIAREVEELRAMVRKDAETLYSHCSASRDGNYASDAWPTARENVVLMERLANMLNQIKPRIMDTIV